MSAVRTGITTTRAATSSLDQSMERICIYCRESKPQSAFNIEHIFPHAVGGRLLAHNVCALCNGKLGSTIDAPLVDHALMIFQRARHELAGASGTVPDPLRLGRATLAADPEQRMRIKTEPESGALKVAFEDRVEKQPTSEGEHFKVVIDKAERANLPAMVNKILTRRGAAPLSDDEILGRAVAGSIDRPEINVSLPIDLVDFRRGLLKICYGLTSHWLGIAYLDDQVGQDISACLLAKSESDCRALRGQATIMSTPPLLPFWAAEEATLVGMLMESSQALHCYVKLFHLFEASFVVSTTPKRYDVGGGFFTRTDVRDGSLIDSSLVDELLRINAAGDSAT